MNKNYYNLFFSSGGNFIHYYLGYGSIIQQFLKNKNYHNKLNLGGVSAGSLASSFIAFDVDINKSYPDFNYKLTKGLGSKSYFNVIDNFVEASHEHFEGKKLIHNLHIYTTKINYVNYKKINLTSEYFEATNDHNKLINYVASSCYLPLFGSNVFYKIDSDYYLDGFLTFDPTNHNIKKLICYSKHIPKYNVTDKYPSSNYNENLNLFNIGKRSAILDLSYEKSRFY